MEAPRPTRRRALLAAAVAAVTLGVGLGAAPVSATAPDDVSISTVTDSTGSTIGTDSQSGMAPVDPSVTEVSANAESLDGTGGDASSNGAQRGFVIRPR